MKAEYKGKQFDIPEMWWAGFSQTNPDLTPAQIVRWWAWQEYMSEHYEVPPEDY